MFDLFYLIIFGVKEKEKEKEKKKKKERNV